MHVLTWILTGLVAGWLARLTQDGRGAGLVTDLVLGGLGAVTGGWIVHMLGLTEPKVGPINVAVAVLGAVCVLAGARLLLRATARAAALAGAQHAAGALASLEAQISRLSEFERQALAKLRHRRPAARDPNQTFDEQLTLGQRVSDRMAAFGGSWGFLGLFFATMLGWMIYNTERRQPFDPYPFILLNLVLSCLAAVQAPVILMSQNRQSQKDRHDARLDYEVNLKAELEILALHEKLDGLREKAWIELVAIQERQLALLARIEQQVANGRTRSGV